MHIARDTTMVSPSTSHLSFSRMADSSSVGDLGVVLYVEEVGCGGAGRGLVTRVDADGVDRDLHL
jgi:hypothetical protein